MEDGRIIQLYYERKEQAIAESDRKYGKLCRRIAGNILGVREDAEECVNDTWYTAWTCVPPQRPRSLGAFLGRITRNLAISRWRNHHAAKRYNGMEVLLSELDECIPDASDVEQAVDRKELAGYLNRWLDSLPQKDAVLFVRRYWYGDAVNTLAAACHCTPNQMSGRMMRLRKKLKAYREQEGITP